MVLQDFAVRAEDGHEQRSKMRKLCLATALLALSSAALALPKPDDPEPSPAMVKAVTALVQRQFPSAANIFVSWRLTIFDLRGGGISMECELERQPRLKLINCVPLVPDTRRGERRSAPLFVGSDVEDPGNPGNGKQDQVDDGMLFPVNRQTAQKRKCAPTCFDPSAL